MARTATLKREAPQSTAQQLGGIVKSCRAIMRKDKGLNGDLDRLPMLTWIMFLKFLDDMEGSEKQKLRSQANATGPASTHHTAGVTGPQSPRA